MSHNKILKNVLLFPRAYGVYCDKVDADPELEHKERSVLEDYSSKLVVDDTVVPDPLTLKVNWKGEAIGITSWPSVYYSDIASFMGLTQSDFIKRMESEYKQGKAYRYYKCDFVREIFFNHISEDSPYCILKCKVVPSQRVNNKPYDVWSVVKKDKIQEPGGEIFSAYCTCTAGLSSTCNHIVGMLFRVEAAVTTGQTNPSKTSVLSSWKHSQRKQGKH